MNSNNLTMSDLENQQSLAIQEASSQPNMEETTSVDYLGRAVVNISQVATNVRDKVAACCCDSDTLISAGVVTGVALLALSPEAFFITGAYYCFNDPQAWGEWCTRGKRGSEHTTTEGAIGYTLGAVAYPALLLFGVLKAGYRRR